MRGDACVIAIGSVSALGAGAEAYRVGPLGREAEVVIRPCPILIAAGLKRPFAARAPADLGRPAGEDRAASLLALAMGEALAALSRERAGFRAERLGVALGTSSGGMLTAERFFAARAEGRLTEELAQGATYFAPFDRVLSEFGLARAEPRTQVLAACAASTVAIGIGLRWLERGECDLVLAGGYDGVSVFVAAGFEALRATTASRSRPFRVGRDGMSLGEGAAVVALVREDDARGARVLARVAGFGASNDAVHITAPDRTGSGLVRAGRAALADADLSGRDVDLVSAHGTATPYNDAMEARAIAQLTGGDAASSPPVHPFKAQIGHTLGAAGVLEALAAAEALRLGIAPAAAGEGELDPDAAVRLLERAEAWPSRGGGEGAAAPRPRAALKLSAAFGGTNASLVLTAGPSERSGRSFRRAFLAAFRRVEDADTGALAEATGVARDRLARLDALCRLGLGAVAALASAVGRKALAGAGIVAGHGLATIDTNDGYDDKKRTKGATAVEPRVFPATSPNAIVGECALVYGLTGPSFSVSAGLDGGTEALRAAALLVSAGDADTMVVVAADDAGPAARDLLRVAGWSNRPLARGAVALLLTASEEGTLREVDPGMCPDHARAPIGHLALLRWLEGLA